MGVPKFYRWISERYPCLSETVKELQVIPLSMQPDCTTVCCTKCTYRPVTEHFTTVA